MVQMQAVDVAAVSASETSTLVSERTYASVSISPNSPDETQSFVQTEVTGVTNMAAYRHA